MTNDQALDLCALYRGIPGAILYVADVRVSLSTDASGIDVKLGDAWIPLTAFEHDAISMTAKLGGPARPARDWFCTKKQASAKPFTQPGGLETFHGVIRTKNVRVRASTIVGIIQFEQGRGLMVHCQHDMKFTISPDEADDFLKQYDALYSDCTPRERAPATATP